MRDELLSGDVRRQAGRRHLWVRTAETREGREILDKARDLSLRPENAHLTDGQLIRLAYWGAAGEP